MNFAYNFINNIHALKSVLISQYRESPEEQLEVSIKSYGPHTRDELFHKEGADEVLCRVEYRPNSIIYYEPKKA